MKNEISKPKVTLIPAVVKPFKGVAIYCRVSTIHGSQEESLDIQIKTLKQIVANNPKWILYNVYTDKDSGGNVARHGFQKLIFDCYENRIDIVLVKTISKRAGIEGSNSALKRKGLDKLHVQGMSQSSVVCGLKVTAQNIKRFIKYLQGGYKPKNDKGKGVPVPAYS